MCVINKVRQQQVWHTGTFVIDLESMNGETACLGWGGSSMAEHVLRDAVELEVPLNAVASRKGGTVVLLQQTPSHVLTSYEVQCKRGEGR